jgi:hypothetical protein
VSEEAVSRAGLDFSAFPQREMEIRGKREMLAVRTLVSAAELPAALLPTSTGRPRQASNGSLSPSIQTNSNPIGVLGSSNQSTSSAASEGEGRSQ